MDKVISDLSADGINVDLLATYKQESDWDPVALLRCPVYDKQIISGRTYGRIVIPLNITDTE